MAGLKKQSEIAPKRQGVQGSNPKGREREAGTSGECCRSERCKATEKGAAGRRTEKLTAQGGQTHAGPRNPAIPSAACRFALRSYKTFGLERLKKTLFSTFRKLPEFLQP